MQRQGGSHGDDNLKHDQHHLGVTELVKQHDVIQKKLVTTDPLRQDSITDNTDTNNVGHLNKKPRQPSKPPKA